MERAKLEAVMHPGSPGPYTENSVQQLYNETMQYPEPEPWEQLVLAQAVQDGIAATAEILSPTDDSDMDFLLSEQSVGGTAEEYMVAANMGLVFSIASDYPPDVAERIDLIGYGCIGLTGAVRGFDPTRGTQFSTYAYPAIRREIDQGLLELKTSGNGTQKTEATAVRTYQSSKHNYLSRHGGEWDPEDFAKEYGYSPAEVYDFETWDDRVDELDRPLRASEDGDNGMTQGDALPSPRAEQGFRLVEGDLGGLFAAIFKAAGLEQSDIEPYVLNHAYSVPPEEIAEKLELDVREVKKIIEVAGRKIPRVVALNPNLAQGVDFGMFDAQAA